MNSSQRGPPPRGVPYGAPAQWDRQWEERGPAPDSRPRRPHRPQLRVSTYGGRHQGPPEHALSARVSGEYHGRGQKYNAPAATVASCLVRVSRLPFRCSLSQILDCIRGASGICRIKMLKRKRKFVVLRFVDVASAVEFFRSSIVGNDAITIHVPPAGMDLGDMGDDVDSRLYHAEFPSRYCCKNTQLFISFVPFRHGGEMQLSEERAIAGELQHGVSRNLCLLFTSSKRLAKRKEGESNADGEESNGTSDETKEVSPEGKQVAEVGAAGPGSSVSSEDETASCSDEGNQSQSSMPSTDVVSAADVAECKETETGRDETSGESKSDQSDKTDQSDKESSTGDGERKRGGKVDSDRWHQFVGALRESDFAVHDYMRQAVQAHMNLTAKSSTHDRRYRAAMRTMSSALNFLDANRGFNPVCPQSVLHKEAELGPVAEWRTEQCLAYALQRITTDIRLFGFVEKSNCLKTAGYVFNNYCSLESSLVALHTLRALQVSPRLSQTVKKEDGEIEGCTCGRGKVKKTPCPDERPVPCKCLCRVHNPWVTPMFLVTLNRRGQFQVDHRRGPAPPALPGLPLSVSIPAELVLSQYRTGVTVSYGKDRCSRPVGKQSSRHSRGSAGSRTRVVYDSLPLSLERRYYPYQEDHNNSVGSGGVDHYSPLTREDPPSPSYVPSRSGRGYDSRGNGMSRPIYEPMSSTVYGEQRARRGMSYSIRTPQRDVNMYGHPGNRRMTEGDVRGNEFIRSDVSPPGEYRRYTVDRMAGYSPHEPHSGHGEHHPPYQQQPLSGSSLSGVGVVDGGTYHDRYPVQSSRDDTMWRGPAPVRRGGGGGGRVSPPPFQRSSTDYGRNTSVSSNTPTLMRRWDSGGSDGTMAPTRQRVVHEEVSVMRSSDDRRHPVHRAPPGELPSPLQDVGGWDGVPSSAMPGGFSQQRQGASITDTRDSQRRFTFGGGEPTSPYSASSRGSQTPTISAGHGMWNQNGLKDERRKVENARGGSSWYGMAEGNWHPEGDMYK